MAAIWGIHNDEIPAAELVKGGFVSIGWDLVGDLTTIGDDQVAVRDSVRRSYPEGKDGAIPIWAGALRRFAFSMQIGDVVIAQDRELRTVNIGTVIGQYRYVGTAQLHHHRRDVDWLIVGVPRSSFSEPALREIGSAQTLIEVRQHASEFAQTLKNAGHTVDINTPTLDDTAPDGVPEALRALGVEYLRAMRDGDSVFTPGKNVWNQQTAHELVASFVERPDEGGRSFDEKLEDQLSGVSDDGLQLFAELWCMNLAPLSDYTTATKQKLLHRVLAKMKRSISLPGTVEAALSTGAFSGGVAFKTRRPFQLALLVRVAMAVSALTDDERHEALDGPAQFAELLRSVTVPNEPAQRRAVRWLLFPDYYLPVVSEKHQTAIRDAFSDLLDGTATHIDEELFQICDRLSNGNGLKGVHFYRPPLLDRWDADRVLSGRPVTPAEVSARSHHRTPRYALASAAIGLIGEGYWTTYSDIAEVVGLTPGQVGEYLSAVEHDSGHRIIKIDGTTYPEYARLPDGVTPREALEAEGISFDLRGAADPSRKITKEDIREQLDGLGLLPKVTKRAWLVRGSNVGGRDLVPQWLDQGRISILATSLRDVDPGVSREELKRVVEDDYAHASYAARSEKVDEFHAFLTRMQTDDLVATIDHGRLYVGRIIGTPEPRDTTEGDANLVRPVAWGSVDGVDESEVPSELLARLKVQRQVLDLTQHVDVLETLLTADLTQLPPPAVAPVELRDVTDELATDLHVDKSWLQECIDLLNDRPQLIFYGPPGTGKTYIAQALAKFAADENVQLVQFHPSYSYEDFLEGYRPTESGGFALRPGPMRRIADKAAENPTVPHFLIIDEINRGNLAKVFGELYFLLEYRGESVRLLYSEEDFSLPRNVYIIGTMNTADRSIALVDAAMRRRFAFLPLHPSEPPTRGILRSWLKSEQLPVRTADLLDELNRRIDDPDFKIGPSYFMRKAVYEEGGLERIWRTSVIPLLEEHHYGEMGRSDIENQYGLAKIASVVSRREEGIADASADTD